MLFCFQSFHSVQPRTMSFKKMDPSCTIGFYCDTKADFERFRQQTTEVSALSSNFLTECRNEIASVLHYFSVWSVQNLELLCRPTRCKTNANHDSVVCVFPRFGQFGCFFFKLSLAQFSFLLIGRWYYFVFGFTSHNRKALWEIFWCLVRLVRVSARSLCKICLR